MQKTTATALSFATVGAVVSLVLVLLLVPRAVPNVGAVTGVGVDVYWDFACTDAVLSIDWGTRSNAGKRRKTRALFTTSAGTLRSDKPIVESQSVCYVEATATR
jgi:hypothetical protein